MYAPVVDFLGDGVPYCIVVQMARCAGPRLTGAGVDAIWPVERAADQMDPVLLRKNMAGSCGYGVASTNVS
jgi:hypothetical protein